MSNTSAIQADIADFQRLREEGYFYVDKTAYIVNLFNKSKHVFISRPRRFGKSLMLSTIKNLFLGNTHLFDGLAIAEHLDDPTFQPHPVIHIDFSDIETLEDDEDNENNENEDKISDKDISQSIDTIKSILLEDIQEIASSYKVSVDDKSPYRAFKNLIRNIAKKGKKVVLLIDEYDLLLNETFNIPRYQKQIRGLLRNFYKNIKYCEEQIHLCYITGVSKFSKLGIFSVANNVIDFSSDPEFAYMFGYTQQELVEKFATHIKETARHLDVSENDLIEKLKSYYDGYSFGGKFNLYNPHSIHMFFTQKEFAYFWIESGKQKFIEEYLSTKNVTVEQFEHVDISASKVRSPGEITKELEPELYLYQAGYLTPRLCPGTKRDYYLTYPNNEVRAAMIELVKHNFFNVTQERKFRDELVSMLDKGNYVDVLLLFNRIYAQIAYTNYARNKDTDKELVLEGPYKSAIFTLLLGAEIDVRLEEATHQGDADLVLRHAGKVTLFEYKVSRTGTEDDVRKQLGIAVDQLRKYKGPHRISVPIAVVIDGTRRRIALASILDKVYAFIEQAEDGTPARFECVCDTDSLPMPSADEAKQ